MIDGTLIVEKSRDIVANVDRLEALCRDLTTQASIMAHLPRMLSLIGLDRALGILASDTELLGKLFGGEPAAP
ncbi:hypothetical protein McPS_32780 [Marichromatium sp. PS1]